jgi:hypothetical protein
MDLYDFFFPEQAEAGHLRSISRSMARSGGASRAAQNNARRAVDEVAELRGDVRFLTLVLATILKRLAENETMSLVDLTDLINEADGLDGVADGGLDLGVLRGILGVLKEETAEETQSEEEQIDIVTESNWSRRYRRR